jgi:pyridoxal phosphate enzyme (YggS family)
MIELIRRNLNSVRERMTEAAERSGRQPTDVRLIGVTKYVDAAVTRTLIAAGCSDVGENRPQALWDKAQELQDLNVNWHLIGHLQRNKVKRSVALAALIHSVDSVRLLDAIQAAAKEAGQVAKVLLEVNVSGDQAKHGLAAEDLISAIEHVAPLSHVAVEGLMCMAGLTGDGDDARRDFSRLRRLADSQQGDLPENVRMSELSMGMSGDFEIAIEEGATLVRVGSLLFEGVS